MLPSHFFFLEQPFWTFLITHFLLVLSGRHIKFCNKQPFLWNMSPQKCRVRRTETGSLSLPTPQIHTHQIPEKGSKSYISSENLLGDWFYLCCYLVSFSPGRITPEIKYTVNFYRGQKMHYSFKIHSFTVH